MSLPGLPAEIQCDIIEHLIVSVGPFRAVNVRLVNKCFNTAYLTAFTTRQIINFDDPAFPYSLWRMLPCFLKARAMLARARRLGTSPAEGQDEFLTSLVETTENLDGLMDMAKSEQLQEQRDLMIPLAEAAAHYYCGPGTEPKLYNNTNAILTLRGQNTLCAAIVLGQLPLVQTLLRDRTDIDVNVESSCFGLPLHIAAAWGHVAIFQHLLDSGADPCVLTQHAERMDPVNDHSPQLTHCPRGSALLSATRAGHGEIVQQMLILPPHRRLPATSPHYVHAIVSAAKGGHVGCIELLVRATGKPLAELQNTLRLDGGSSVPELMLWAAARGGHAGMVSLLLDDPQLQLDVDAQRCGAFQNGSALHLAAARGDTALSRLLVERYAADVDLQAYQNGDPCRPYEVAARAGYRETLEFLLAASSNEHAVADSFRSAARAAQLGILAWLLGKYGREMTVAAQAYPDFEDIDTVGQAELLYALGNPAPGVISFLVREAGVSLHEGLPSYEGRLPVAVAKVEASRWMVDFLLRLGAEDVTVDEDDIRNNSYWESVAAETQPLLTIRGVQVSDRTWRWV